jgi:serpin B
MTPIVRALALGASLSLASLGRLPDAAGAQAPGSPLAGKVDDAESGRGVWGARIVAGPRVAQSDSLGDWSFASMTPGPTRVRVLRIGFRPFDTTVVIPAVGQMRLDVHLQSRAVDRAMELAAKAETGAGRIDSSAFGLLRHSGSDSSLTFGAFGARFLYAVAGARAPDSNTIVSPTSAAFALSIPLLGAGGSTATEIATALGIQGMSRDVVRRRTAAAMTAGTGRSDVQLEIANAIWVDTSVRLNPHFVDEVSSYRAVARTKALAAPGTVNDVNKWADSVTHGKIAKVLDKPLPDTSQLFVANAVYFKGKWLQPFEKKVTRPRDFRLASGNVVKVAGMERTGHVGYARGDRYQMIRLPYRGGRFAMYVVLPDAGTPAAVIEQAFATRGMPASLAQKDFREVHVVLPRLHAELSYDLAPALKALGIHRAFDCNDADFHEIATNVAGIGLCIGKLSQVVYLDVDEEGTEAAAVTGIGMVTATALGPPPLEFIVDRPFLILLRDEPTGADLFVGTIRRP